MCVNTRDEYQHEIHVQKYHYNKLEYVVYVSKTWYYVLSLQWTNNLA